MTQRPNPPRPRQRLYLFTPILDGTSLDDTASFAREIEAALAAADIAAVLLPTFVYVEDNLNGRVENLILCGFGAESDEAQRRFTEELAVPVDVLRSPLGIPGENDAGLLGYLRSIAKNN